MERPLIFSSLSGPVIYLSAPSFMTICTIGVRVCSCLPAGIHPLGGKHGIGLRDAEGGSGQGTRGQGGESGMRSESWLHLAQDGREGRWGAVGCCWESLSPPPHPGFSSCLQNHHFLLLHAKKEAHLLLLYVRFPFFSRPKQRFCI